MSILGAKEAWSRVLVGGVGSIDFIQDIQALLLLTRDPNSRLALLSTALPKSSVQLSIFNNDTTSETAIVGPEEFSFMPFMKSATVWKALPQ